MKLNKFIFLTTLVLLLPILASAKVNVDVEAAPQFSTKIAFRAGLSIEIPVSNNFSIDPGLYYSMKHRQSKEDIKTTSSTGEVLETDECELDGIGHFLQFPVYLSYNISTRDTDLQKIMFGPYFAYYIGGNTDIIQRFNGTETSRISSPTYPTILNSKLDFGLALEYKYILKSHFVFGLFVDVGLKNIFSSIDIQTDNDKWPIESFHLNPGSKINQTIGLSIGYRF